MGFRPWSFVVALAVAVSLAAATATGSAPPPGVTAPRWEMHSVSTAPNSFLASFSPLLVSVASTLTAPFTTAAATGNTATDASSSLSFADSVAAAAHTKHSRPPRPARSNFAAQAIANNAKTNHAVESGFSLQSIAVSAVTSMASLSASVASTLASTRASYSEPAPLRAKLVTDDINCSAGLCRSGINVLHDSPRPYSNGQTHIPMSLIEMDFSSSDSTNYLTGLAVIGAGIPLLFAILTIISCCSFCCARSCCNCCGQRVATQKYSAKSVFWVKVGLAVWLAAMIVVTVLAVYLNHAMSSGLNATVDAGDATAWHIEALSSSVAAVAEPVRMRADQLAAVDAILTSLPLTAEADEVRTCFSAHSSPVLNAQGTAAVAVRSVPVSAAAQLSGLPQAAAALTPPARAAAALLASRSDLYDTSAGTAAQRFNLASSVLYDVKTYNVLAVVNTTNAAAFFDNAANAALRARIGSAHALTLAASLDAPTTEAPSSGSVRAYSSLITALKNNANVDPNYVQTALAGMSSASPLDKGTCDTVVSKLTAIKALYDAVTAVETNYLGSESSSTWVRATFSPAYTTLWQSADIADKQLSATQTAAVDANTAVKANARAVLIALERLDFSSDATQFPFAAAVVRAVATLRAALMAVDSHATTFTTAISTFNTELTNLHDSSSGATLIDNPLKQGLDTAAAAPAANMAAADCMPDSLGTIQTAAAALGSMPSPLDTTLQPALPALKAQFALAAAWDDALTAFARAVTAAQTALASASASAAASKRNYTQMAASTQAMGIQLNTSSANAVAVDAAAAAATQVVTAARLMLTPTLLAAYNTTYSVLSSALTASTTALSASTALTSVNTYFTDVMTAVTDVRSALTATASHVAATLAAVDCTRAATSGGDGFAGVSSVSLSVLASSTGGLRLLVPFTATGAQTGITKTATALTNFSSAVAQFSSQSPSLSALSDAATAMAPFSADALPASPTSLARDVLEAQKTTPATTPSLFAKFLDSTATIDSLASALAGNLGSASIVCSDVLSRLDPNGSSGTAGSANMLPVLGAGLEVTVNGTLDSLQTEAMAATTAPFPHPPLYRHAFGTPESAKLNAYLTVASKIADSRPDNLADVRATLDSALSAVDTTVTKMNDFVDGYFDARVTVKRDVYVVDEQRLIIVDVFVLATMLFILIALITCLNRKHKPMMMLAMLLFGMAFLIFIISVVHIAPGILVSDFCYSVPVSMTRIAGEYVSPSTLAGLSAFLGESSAEPLSVEELYEYLVDCKGPTPDVIQQVQNASTDSASMQEQALGSLRSSVSDTLAGEDITLGGTLADAFSGMDDLSAQMVASAKAIADEIRCETTQVYLDPLINISLCRDFSGAFATVGCVLFLFALCLYPGIVLSVLAFKRLNKRNGLEWVPKAPKGKYKQHHAVTLKPGMQAAQLKGFTPAAVAAMSTAFTNPMADNGGDGSAVGRSNSANQPLQSRGSAIRSSSGVGAGAGANAAPRASGVSLGLGPGPRPSQSTVAVGAVGAAPGPNAPSSPANKNAAVQRGTVYQVPNTPSQQQQPQQQQSQPHTPQTRTPSGSFSQSRSITTLYTQTASGNDMRARVQPGAGAPGPQRANMAGTPRASTSGAPGSAVEMQRF